MEADGQIDDEAWQQLETLVTQEVSLPGLHLDGRRIRDVSSESRLRFNAIVEALVVEVEFLCLDGERTVRFTVEAVYWPEHDEWEIEDLTIRRPGSGTDS